VKTKVAFAAALILAIAAAIGVREIIESYKAEESGKQLSVAYAAVQLNVGDELMKEKVKVAKRIGITARAGDITSDGLVNVIGKKVTRFVPTGDVLNYGDFERPAAETSFTSSVLKDHRAITIPVDQVSGVAGLIQPRDRVDVLATMQYSGAARPSGSTGTTETMTVLENVRVLAVDNRSAQYASIPDRLRREGRSGYTSVTLLVTPEEARILTLAQSQAQGMLMLTLRNPMDNSSDVQKTSLDDLWDSITKAAAKHKTTESEEDKSVPVDEKF